MRRSICFTEPSVTLAGKTGTWKFVYTPSNNLPKGTLLKFDLLSKGRPIDWEVPQTSPRTKSNLIWAEIKDGKTINAKRTEDELFSQFEFTLPEEIKAGEKFAILMGSPTNDPKKGNRAQKLIQRKRPFHLYVDTKGKGDYKDPETFQLDIRGNVLKQLRIITPSVVMRNKRFDVIVRFEDEYGNLTANAPEETLVDLSYEHIRENLNWKLFVPETGFITLPNLYFNEPGIYRIKLNNLHTKESFFSPPIKCYQDNDLNLFWGLFHGESERFDASENIESCLRYFRDEKALHFFGTSSFDAEEETSNDIWKLINNQITEFNEDDRFSSFLGFQWKGEAKEEGVRQFLYTKDSKPIIRKKDTRTNSLKKIYKTHQTKDMISIPSFTMNKECPYDFSDFNSDFEKVVEIYNSWGSSECTEKEGNLRPIKGKGKNSSNEDASGSIQTALMKGCRFGFIAGGADDRGVYEKFYDADQTQYTPGLTAVLSKDHSRSSILSSLSKKACYATTGARIVIGLYIADERMGSELTSADKPGFEFNRHITGYAIGTDNLKEVQIIRNNKVLKSYKPEDDKFEFELDDMEPLSKVAIKTKDETPPFAFYYLRVIQNDGHIAWSSPIWVDSEAPKPVVKKTRKK